MGSACAKDYKAWMLSGYANYKYQVEIGIAKDGHILYGPYTDQGTLTDCSTLDICNGKMTDSSYAYFATGSSPYTVGCYGPGEANTMNASCSSNGCPNTIASASGSFASRVQIMQICLILTVLGYLLL